MATITITRSFKYYVSRPSLLIPVHLPTSMEVSFDRGAISGSYVEIVVNSTVFMPTKINTVGNVDTYQLNGDMLKYFLGIPAFDTVNTGSLVSPFTVVCNGYNSAGTLLATTTDTQAYLCHSINASTTEGLYALYNTGRTYTGNIYFTLWFYYFDSVTKEMVRAYNPPSGEFINGVYTLNVVNVPELTGSKKKIAWLNSDGCYDIFDFLLVTTERQSKKGSSVSLYADQLYKWKGNEINMSNDVEETIQLRAIAINEEHYAQLYFITQSMLIMEAASGKIFELSSPPAPLAACKQNLNFTFSLKRKIHAQSY